MTQNNNNSTELHRHHVDVERIQRVLLQNGYNVDYNTAVRMWSNYSDDEYAAGWVGLPNDDVELWDILDYIISESPTPVLISNNAFEELARWLVRNRFSVFMDADIPKDSKKRILNQLGHSSSVLDD